MSSLKCDGYEVFFFPFCMQNIQETLERIMHMRILDNSFGNMLSEDWFLSYDNIEKKN